MSINESRPRFSRLNIPVHISIINYIGVPLYGHISEFAKDTYSILRKLGPNDGLSLLNDQIAPNSVTILEFGIDHYFNEDPEIDLKTVALTKTIITYIESKKKILSKNTN
jgi:hypothetical protein